MMENKKIATSILLACFLLFPICAHPGPYSSKCLIEYDGAISGFFNDIKGDYRIAYQAKSFSSSRLIPDEKVGQIRITPEENFERIDVIVSNFNGANKKNITESIDPGENIAFVLPKWSPDGKKLAFCSIKYEKEGYAKQGYVEYTAYTDIYVMDGSTLKLQKLYSYRSENVQIGFGTYIFVDDGVGWSKDSDELTVYIESTSDSQKAKGYKGTRILVSLDPNVAPQEFFGDDDNSFTQFSREAPISPDKKCKLIQAEEKDIPLTPGDPGFGMDLRPKLTFGRDALYLNKGSLGGKIKIYDGFIDGFFWTKDSDYAILYSHWDKADQFYIVNLKGEHIVIDGAKPQLQFSNVYD